LELIEVRKEDLEEDMLGSTAVLPDISAYSIGEYPDVASHLVTLQLRNQDSYGSQYGYKGTDYDYVLDVRSSYETQRQGLPRFSRHNVNMAYTKRATVSGGVVTPAIPYTCAVTFRLPDTGTVANCHINSVALLSWLLTNAANKFPKIMNFES
jgi:hypothetical protein